MATQQPPTQQTPAQQTPAQQTPAQQTPQAQVAQVPTREATPQPQTAGGGHSSAVTPVANTNTPPPTTPTTPATRPRPPATTQPAANRPPEVAAATPRPQPRPGVRPISTAECQRLPVNDPTQFFQLRELCQRAAEGSVQANYQLGVMYADGQGVPVRRELAVRLLSVAASRGLRPAVVRLEQMGYAAPSQ